MVTVDSLFSAISHMRVEKENFLIWGDASGNDYTKEIQQIIEQEKLPYINGGCFMGAHAWIYKPNISL